HEPSLRAGASAVRPFEDRGESEAREPDAEILEPRDMTPVDEGEALAVGCDAGAFPAVRRSDASPRASGGSTRGARRDVPSRVGYRACCPPERDQSGRAEHHRPHRDCPHRTSTLRGNLSSFNRGAESRDSRRAERCPGKPACLVAARLTRSRKPSAEPYGRFDGRGRRRSSRSPAGSNAWTRNISVRSSAAGTRPRSRPRKG